MAIVTHTIEGSVASFKSMMPSKITRLEADITPVQDLHGYSNPWPAGGGKNIADMSDANIVIGKYIDNSGSIKSNDNNFYNSKYISVLPSTDYTISVSSLVSYLSIMEYDANKTFVKRTLFGNSSSPNLQSGTVTTQSNTAFVLFGSNVNYSAISLSDVKALNWQFEQGSTATSYVPYENVCPISGWTGVNISKTGVNIWDEEWELCSFDITTGAEMASTITIRSKNYIGIIPQTEYRFINGGIDVYVCIVYYNRAKQILSVISGASGGVHANTVFTTPAGAYYMRFYMPSGYGSIYGNNISVNYPSTDTAYHPYTGEQIAVEFPALGVNQWDEQWELGAFDTSNGNNLSSSAQIRVKNRILVSPSTSYCFVNKGAGTAWMIFYDANGQVITEGLPTGNRAGNSVNLTDGTIFVTPSNCISVRFYMTQPYGATYGNNISINYPATATSYEPYTNTVYGGSLNLSTGVLTVTQAELDKTGYTVDDTYGGRSARIATAGIFDNNRPNSSIGKYSNPLTPYNWIKVSTDVIRVGLPSDATAEQSAEIMNDFQLVLKLKTPITYQLTPQQISTLVGTNNLWADTGDISLDWQLIAGDVKLSERRRSHIASAPHLETASGAIASFNTNTALPLKKCEFAIEPVQSGSGDPSPTNVRPISGWTGVNGWRTGKNIWDEESEAGYYDISTGEKASGSNWTRCKNFIPVKPSTSYYFYWDYPNTGSFGGVLFYDKNKTFLSAESTSANVLDKAFTTPTDCAYITFYARSNWFENVNISINYPATETAYTPYVGTSIPVEFPAQGKNLLNINAPFKNPSNTTITADTKRVFMPNTYCVGTSWSNWYQPHTVTASVANGVLSVFNTNVYGAGFAVKLEAGEQYILSATASGGRADYAFYAEDGTWLSGLQNKLGSAVTIPSNADITVVTFYAQSDGTTATFTNIQLEKGSTATSYEPYTNTVYGGTVDVTTGVLTVNKQHVVVNGDTKLNKGGSPYYGDYGTNTYVNIPSVGFSAAEIMYKPCYADMAQKTNALLWTNTDSNIWKYAINAYTQLHIVFENTVVGITSEMTADERNAAIKVWLASNPMHFVLPLATPITYQLTPQQITALKGQNNVWCDTGNTTVKYWKH